MNTFLNSTIFCSSERLIRPSTPDRPLNQSASKKSFFENIESLISMGHTPSSSPINWKFETENLNGNERKLNSSSPHLLFTNILDLIEVGHSPSATPKPRKGVEFTDEFNLKKYVKRSIVNPDIAPVAADGDAIVDNSTREDEERAIIYNHFEKLVSEYLYDFQPQYDHTSPILISEEIQNEPVTIDLLTRQLDMLNDLLNHLDSNSESTKSTAIVSHSHLVHQCRLGTYTKYHMSVQERMRCALDLTNWKVWNHMVLTFLVNKQESLKNPENIEQVLYKNLDFFLYRHIVMILDRWQQAYTCINKAKEDPNFIDHIQNMVSEREWSDWKKFTKKFLFCTPTEYEKGRIIELYYKIRPEEFVRREQMYVKVAEQP